VANGEQTFLSGLLRTAKELPLPILEKVCRCLESLPVGCPVEDRAQVALQITNPEMRHAFAKVLRECGQAAPEMSPERLAWFLRGASAMDQGRRANETLDLVWTGPTVETLPLRRTDQVLLDLINAAEREILIVAYAAYKVPELVSAMKVALARGVRILLVLEGMEAGTLKFDGLPALGKDVCERAEIYVWPADKRLSDEKGNRGALHAKCAVADRTTLLVTSANLTEAALARNIELGVQIKGGESAQKVWSCFDSLVRDGVLLRSKLQSDVRG
jgi:phosphatidylserine/phosphatidylglycerophosphate/cardiolipin synthase-like enzyme